MIRCDDLVLNRGGEFTLAADLDFRAGRCTVLLGPSGAGKSTLFDGLAGFLAPARGRILIGGTDITDAPPDRRPLSILFQDNNLFPHMTVFENAALGRDPGLRLSSRDRDAVHAMLERVGISGLAERYPRALSGGQASRAGLARALLRDKPVLLLDEPFAALGPGMRADLGALVRRIIAERGLTVLAITHAPEDAERIADDIAVVADGRVLAPANAVDVLAAPPEPLRRYLGR